MAATQLNPTVTPLTAIENDHYPDIIIDGYPISLSTFLHYCATGCLQKELAAGKHNTNIALYREYFIKAGLTETYYLNQQDGWIQYNLMPDGPIQSELYHQLADFFSSLLDAGTIKNAFFMHKPPGLRIRLQATAPSETETLKGIVSQQIGLWKRYHLLNQYRHTIYEPEISLFGGPLSMPWVHELFTADSLYWLRFHAQKTVTSSIHILKLSLVLLRYFFAALHIVDWEDLDVWEKVAQKTGRTMPGEITLESSILKEVESAITEIWENPNIVLSSLEPQERHAIEVIAARFNELGQQWQSNYFQTEQAFIGPRSAAAAYVIFFWNRANLNFEQQRIATYALRHRNILS